MRSGFVIFLFFAFFGDFIANEKPLICQVKGKMEFPAFRQKGIEWRIAESDSSFYARNWLTFSEYDWAVRAPVHFSAGTIDLRGEHFDGPFRHPHLLGTDRLGRDVLAGLIEGCAVAFKTGFSVMIIAVFLGLLFGVVAGYFPVFWDYPIMSLIEIKRSVPGILWIFAVAAILRQCSLFQIILIIALLSWPNIALLVRSSVIKVKNEDYITAAKALGFSKWRILTKHILPNCLQPVYVAAAALIPAAITTESALTFLGIGLPLNTVTWGSILRQAQNDIDAWWLALFPGLCLFFVVILFNSWAENLRKKDNFG